MGREGQVSGETGGEWEEGGWGGEWDEGWR